MELCQHWQRMAVEHGFIISFGNEGRYEQSYDVSQAHSEQPFHVL
jgi:hypothetical protein